MTSSSRITDRTKIWTSGVATPVICPQKVRNGSRVFSFFGVKPAAGDSSSATPVRCFDAASSE